MILLLGDGGHADVLEDSFGKVDARVLLHAEEAGERKYLTEDDALKLEPADVTFLNGIGFLGGLHGARQGAYELFSSAGFAFPAMVDKTATVRSRVQLGRGAQVLMGAMLNTQCGIGENTIINTGVVVEHHALIGAHSHVAPGATICGSAQIGDAVLIGAGAIVIHGVTIPGGSIVGAGAVVTTSFASAGVFVGCPARPINLDR